MKILRKIIEIDEELCNGCGQCVPACEEGAIEIVDGKARLVAEKYCDGLGACLGDCPTGALKIVEREAEDFDEKAVEEYLRAKKAGNSGLGAEMACGCPSLNVMSFGEKTPCEKANKPIQHYQAQSALTHWPVQIRLVPPSAPFLKGADLLVAADCVPVAYPFFHRDLLQGRSVLLGCPKFDDADEYIHKFTQIFKEADIKSVTAAIMEVPCCSSMLVILDRALKAAGEEMVVNKVVVSPKGTVL